MNPGNSGRPDIFNKQEESFEESQKRLQQLLRDISDTDYNTNLPVEPSEYNIAKANNAYDRILQESTSFFGRLNIINELSNEVVRNIREEAWLTDGRCINDKFTYNQAATVKFFGRGYISRTSSGYGGLAAEGHFSNSGANKLEIKKSITIDFRNLSESRVNFTTERTDFANYVETQINAFKSRLLREAGNSTVWKTDNIYPKDLYKEK
jgi:hypothetical protein